jgi:hypothetical protein
MTRSANEGASTEGYKVRLSATGSRCLYRDGRLLATNLATSSCVDYAIKRDTAYREALAWHKALAPGGAASTWKRLRAFLGQYELKKAHLYPVMRRILGRMRDLRDGRQLSLRAFVVLPGGKSNSA